jgi:hypothetical protein
MNLVTAAGATSNLQAVRRSSRRSITGESANQSTKLPAVRVKPPDRDYFIADLGARSITGADKAALLPRHCREKHGGIEPEGLLHRRWYEANVGHLPAGSNIETLSHACRLLWNVLVIVLRFLSRTKRLRFSTFENALTKTSSNQLVRSKQQEWLK